MRERLVVIGGDAGGMAAASQARRRRPDLEIVALEMGRHTSYAACGIPGVIAGDIIGLDALVARSPQEFRAMQIDVRTEHVATAVDIEARTVEVHSLAQQRPFTLGFDLLHFGTGATPLRPDLPGFDQDRVRGVQTLADAGVLLQDLEDGPVEHVVVVGGGYVGLEMAEAFVKRGTQVTVIVSAPEVMKSFDPDMGTMVSQAMRKEGIEVRTGERVQALDGDTVITDAGVVRADLVILGTGVRPNSDLAAAAGLATGVEGGIVVDRRQRTAAEGVYAAGDCCQSFHLVSRQPVYISLGTVANKMARVAGINLGGGYATFPGVLGTAATKLCALELARTGLAEHEASEAGFGYIAAKIDSTTRAGYFPGAAPITVKLLVERSSGRLLGGQLAGGPGSAKRIDVLATAITAGMTAGELVDLDLAYAPPFSTVWDPWQVAARLALEKLS